MFDAIATHYDLLNHLLSAGIDRRWRRRTIQSLRLTGRERVLDLCTGTADLAIAARTARPPAARVVGVDFAASMLRVASEKLRRNLPDGSIALIRGDATQTPVADGSVDAVTIAFGIRNVNDVRAACEEIRRFAILEFGVPTRAGLRAVYLWYFHRILPRIGRLVSRHRAAYAYLPASVTAFPTPDEFVTILRQRGFVDVCAVPLTFGIVFLYTGRRSA